jgi:hypothetical protein
MTAFEYKVIQAPKRPERARGVKGTEARFAHTLETEMNRLGAEGWEYQRSDTLPCETGNGLTGRSTTMQTLLVFRRALPVRERAAPQTAPQSEIRREPVLRATETPLTDKAAGRDDPEEHAAE